MPFTDLERPLYQRKADLFKGLAHPVRIRVLELVAQAPERSVAELLQATGMEPSHLSQHLAVLRRCRLVRAERRASFVFYRLADPGVAALLTTARSLLVGDLEHGASQLGDARELPTLSTGAGPAPAGAGAAGSGAAVSGTAGQTTAAP